MRFLKKEKKKKKTRRKASESACQSSSRPAAVTSVSFFLLVFLFSPPPIALFFSIHTHRTSAELAGLRSRMNEASNARAAPGAGAAASERATESAADCLFIARAGAGAAAAAASLLLFFCRASAGAWLPATALSSFFIATPDMSRYSRWIERAGRGARGRTRRGLNERVTTKIVRSASLVDVAPLFLSIARALFQGLSGSSAPFSPHAGAEHVHTLLPPRRRGR